MGKNGWKIENNIKRQWIYVKLDTHTHSKLSAVHERLVGKSTTKPSQCARNFGVLFDKHVSMVSQVTNICKSANYHFRNIGTFRELLTDASAKQLIHSLISSQLDYCNSLLLAYLMFNL